MVSVTSAMSRGRLAGAAGMPAARRRSQAAQPGGAAVRAGQHGDGPGEEVFPRGLRGYNAPIASSRPPKHFYIRV